MLNMLRVIEKLQAKPESFRKKITIFISGFAVLILFLAWVVSLRGHSLGATDESSASSSPFVEIKNVSSQIYESFREQFGD